MTQDYVFVWTEDPSKHKELIMRNASVTLPTEGIPAGSTAYTADLSHMEMFDGTEWKEIGGGD